MLFLVVDAIEIEFSLVQTRRTETSRVRSFLARTFIHDESSDTIFLRTINTSMTATLLTMK